MELEFHEVFTRLRQQAGLSQSEVAERLFVTRQAVSRWERGETLPEVETLQALSKLFGVSINTLLGSPRTLTCQSCGMPLTDDILARDRDGSLNERYCMWCWDGEGFAQDCTLEEMVEHCLPHMQLGGMEPETCRAYLESLLPTLEKYYDYKVFLKLDVDSQYGRLQKRESKEKLIGFINRWIPEEERYFSQYYTSSCADLIFDTSDKK